MMIRNIWAVGRNYADHAKEMGDTPTEKPLVFLKAGSSATVNSTEIILPWWSEEIHHEVELALKFSPSMHIAECAVAIDLTERKVQSAAKKAGEPWTLAKSFDGACPVSAFFMIKNLNELKGLKIKLWVNDELRQEASLDDMIHPAQKLLNHISMYFPVCAGDLILTGTPAGVAALHPGDVVKAQIEGQITHTWKVVKESPPAPAAVQE